MWSTNTLTIIHWTIAKCSTSHLQIDTRATRWKIFIKFITILDNFQFDYWKRKVNDKIVKPLSKWLSALFLFTDFLLFTSSFVWRLSYAERSARPSCSDAFLFLFFRQYLSNECIDPSIVSLQLQRRVLSCQTKPFIQYSVFVCKETHYYAFKSIEMRIINICSVVAFLLHAIYCNHFQHCLWFFSHFSIVKLLNVLKLTRHLAAIASKLVSFDHGKFPNQCRKPIHFGKRYIASWYLICEFHD